MLYYTELAEHHQILALTHTDTHTHTYVLKFHLLFISLPFLFVTV